ncbi:hypothetical protein [Brevibacillus laterosporus]|nr:hypothetical protein [Brevibacillus laterosporus]MED1667253.1 hypothetical protein [Brevibacillus laterosporus]MED1719679.1 hypothetical protein [Brevibacillus laterosporus]
MEEYIQIDDSEMAEFISNELLKEGIIVKREDLLKVFELEMAFYKKKGLI